MKHVGTLEADHIGNRAARGYTRAQIDAAAGAGQLLVGEPYLIADENRLAVGTAVNAYAAAAKSADISGSGLNSVAMGFGNIVTGTGAAAIGYTNSASGTRAIAMGSNNSASGSYAVAMGYSNSVSSSYSVALGRNNTASGNSAVAMGYNNSASGAYSVALGVNTGANSIDSKFVLGSIGGVLAGAQTGLLTLQWTTTSATPARLCSNTSAAAGTNQLNLPTHGAQTFDGLVVARQSAAQGTQAAAWRVEGLIIRGATAASTVLVASSVTPISNTPGWVLELSADTVNGGLAVTFAGADATNIRCVASLRTSETIYA